MPLKLGEWFIPRKSSNGQTCVETKFSDDAVYVRNSLNPGAGTVAFTHDEWRAFIASAHDGDYDL
jgi:hypothetical protein